MLVQFRIDNGEGDLVVWNVDQADHLPLVGDHALVPDGYGRDAKACIGTVTTRLFDARDRRFLRCVIYVRLDKATNSDDTGAIPTEGGPT